MREAIIKLDDEELEAIGLGEFVAATRAAGLLDVTELVCSGAGGLLEVVVEEPIPATDLDRLECVEWWEQLEETESRLTYLCQVEPADHSEHAIDDHATAHDISDVRERGIDLSVVGSQEEIRRSVEPPPTAFRRCSTSSTATSSPAERVPTRSQTASTSPRM
jgi:hypothetical protein